MSIQLTEKCKISEQHDCFHTFLVDLVTFYRHYVNHLTYRTTYAVSQPCVQLENENTMTGVPLFKRFKLLANDYFSRVNDKLVSYKNL
jgi:hypothetical protein